MTNLNTCVKTPAGTVVTPKGRFSYAQYLLHPQEKQKTKDGKVKRQLSFLIPGDADIALLKEMVGAALREKFPSIPEHKKKSVKSPFLDAYEKTGDEQFKGWTLLRVSTTSMPAIVDARNVAIASDKLDEEVYSGRWGRISLRAFGYERDGNMGVSFALSNVQLLDHDDPLGGGRVNPENEFAPVEVAAGESADSLFS